MLGIIAVQQKQTDTVFKTHYYLWNVETGHRKTINLYWFLSHAINLNPPYVNLKY